jgi:hypothetical protein
MIRLTFVRLICLSQSKQTRAPLQQVFVVDDLGSLAKQRQHSTVSGGSTFGFFGRFPVKRWARSACSLVSMAIP